MHPPASSRPGARDTLEVALGLGANLGRPVEQLREAVGRVAEAGFRVDAVSSVYRSAPVGYGDQPDFYNGVVVGRWRGDPRTLLAVTRGIEAAAGRVRSFPDAPRTLDIDLLLGRDRVWQDTDLVLPHPRWRERSFVLAPLAEVVPHWTDPVSGETVQDVWDRLRSRRPPVTVVGPPADLWSPPA